MKNTLLAFTLAAFSNLPSAAQTTAPTAIHVAACGLEFDLPAGYKITRPQRQADARYDQSCAFDIVKAKPGPPLRGECKDEQEGGQPPYHVCDWEVNAGPPTPSVRVARIRPGTHAWLDSFTRTDDGRWMVPNAHAGDQPAEAFSFFGKPAWKGEHVVRMFWWRTRTKNYTGIYAGSGGADVTLVQLAPDLFVQLANPPDDAQGGCQTFCASLRLGARAQDLP
ncbi:hypothetical protein GmRootA79_53440 (plasmid) [Acidovorax sp. A79]|uniref:hypothetical protein n=1 Tax=Acidovorax sp. A79 TaxID=3056107 RepID=UPI0034E8B958